MIDAWFEDHGSICLVRPASPAGEGWIDEYLPEDAMWFGGAVAVEPRYVESIWSGMVEDGLEVRTDGY